MRAPRISEIQELFARPDATVHEPRRRLGMAKRISGAKEATERPPVQWSNQKSIDLPSLGMKNVDVVNMSETARSAGRPSEHPSRDALSAEARASEHTGQTLPS